MPRHKWEVGDLGVVDYSACNRDGHRAFCNGSIVRFISASPSSALAWWEVVIGHVTVVGQELFDDDIQLEFYSVIQPMGNKHESIS